MWGLSVVLAVRLAACSGLALWSCVRAEGWPSCLVMAVVAALMLAMTVGATARV